MEHNIDSSTGDWKAPSLLILGWVFNLMTIIDRAWITFALGTIVTLLAGYYYLLQIRKLRREEKQIPNNKKTD